MKKGTKIVLISILSIFLLVFIIRTISPKEIDDLNPYIPCEQKYLEKSDTIWVIPKYNNIPISDNMTWCNEISSMNKTIGMHGIYHSYHEFDYYVNETELEEGIEIFRQCFGYEPTIFKPPYLRISKENKRLIEDHGMTIKRFFNQDTRKVYHCEDSGTFPNWLHDIF